MYDGIVESHNLRDNEQILCSLETMRITLQVNDLLL